jgi:hypothetical protein
MEIKTADNIKAGYRHIFLVENRNMWEACPFDYDGQKDIVLTFDFGLYRQMEAKGSAVAYLDHLASVETLTYYNYETCKYFGKWYYDKEGKDIFEYRDLSFGNAFRIEIWNDITYSVRLCINLIALKKISCDKLYVGLTDRCTMNLLPKLGFKYETWRSENDNRYCSYYFPVFKWMYERIYKADHSAKGIIKSIISSFLDLWLYLCDKLGFSGRNIKYVYVWQYHPTLRIIQQLIKDRRMTVVAAEYWKSSVKRIRRLPIYGFFKDYKALAAGYLEKFNKTKVARWEIEGFEISDVILSEIIARIKPSLPYHLKAIDSIIRFYSDKQLALMITISDLGIVNCLMMNYCRKNNIPIYLIINGLLGELYIDEAKNATWINSYGVSIKDNYYKGMSNIVCLGDPRMDDYVNNIKRRDINRKEPTVLIGAAGFSNADLTSYLAIEFDFINDVIKACEAIIKNGSKIKLKVKVRPNGYIEQYRELFREYFDRLNIEVYDTTPIKELLKQADLYISVNSQTLFEASVIGIPVIYYKKDKDCDTPPFDLKSELVTAVTIDELEKNIRLFQDGDNVFDKFLDKKVMEKYIGPLDGHSLEKNMEFIYSKTMVS